MAFGDKQGAAYADGVQMAEKLKAQYENPPVVPQAPVAGQRVVDRKELKL